MTRPTTPQHWAAGKLPEELTTLLESADSDAPSAAIDRVRARLDAALGADFAPQVKPQLANTSAKATAHVARGKWLGLGAILAVGVSVLFIARPEPDAGASVKQPPSAAAASTPTAGDASDQEPELPTETPRPDELQLAAADAPARPPPAAESPARVAKRSPQRTAAPAGLAEELRQLKQIREHVTSAPARALLEADAHARRFPQGTLGPERELLRIDALLRLGRSDEARKLANQQLAAPGGTPYRTRIEKLLAPR